MITLRFRGFRPRIVPGDTVEVRRDAKSYAVCRVVQAAFDLDEGTTTVQLAERGETVPEDGP